MKIESSLFSPSQINKIEFAAQQSLQNDDILASFYASLAKNIECVLRAYSTSATEVYSQSSSDSASFSASDIFHLGYFWDYIKENNIPLEEVYSEIMARRKELKEQKEHWRSFAQQHHETEFSERLKQSLDTGFLIPCQEGAGSAYFLYSQDKKPMFVIKPVDEDILCINNRKQLASPFTGEQFRVKDAIPLYRSAQTDTLCYRVAQMLQLRDITPKTELWVIRSEVFYDITFNLSDEQKEQLLQIIGGPDCEKLCSVQEYVPDSLSMRDKLYEWYENDTIEQLNRRICPEDLEDANLFIWTIFDADAHPGNFLFYDKSTDEQGETIYGIKKVDNGLSFPEKNAELTNFLMYLDEAKKPLSQRLKDKISAIPLESIIQSMQELELSLSSMVAFVERVRVIQELAKRECISVYEINLRLMLLSQEDGIEQALGNQAIVELEHLIGLTSLAPTTSSMGDS